MFAVSPVQLYTANTVSVSAARKQGSALKVVSVQASPPKASPVADRKSRFNNKKIKKRSSANASAAASPADPGPPPAIPVASKSQRDSTEKSKYKSNVLSDNFGEHPRNPPPPPTRANSDTRPASELFFTVEAGSAPAVPTSAPQDQDDGVPQQEESVLPPPIPRRSPRRQRSDPVRKLGLGSAVWSEPLLTEETLDAALESFRAKKAADEARVTATEVVTQPSKRDSSSTTSSDASYPKSKAASIRSSESSAQSIVSRISKTSSNSPRSSAAASFRSATRDLDDFRRYGSPVRSNSPVNRLRDPKAKEPESSRGTLDEDESAVAKKRRRGETMSMLLDTGFFPIQEFIYNRSGVDGPKKVPPPLHLVGKALPSIPETFLGSPVELFPGGPKAPRIVKGGMNRAPNPRSPLGQLSPVSIKSNSTGSSGSIKSISSGHARQCSNTLSNGLFAIPEYAATTETLTSPSGVATPLTQLRLKNGSVLTIAQPEQTPWRKKAYVQGPIRIAKTKVSRQTSIGSVEPVQEAIEQAIQDALNMPSEISENEMADDICDFFDNFHFDEVTYDGDTLAKSDIIVDEMRQLVADVASEMERFSTPPPFLPTILEASPTPPAMPAVPVADRIPRKTAMPLQPLRTDPVQTEESLRTKSIARQSMYRLSGSPSSSPASSHRRIDSGKLSDDDLVFAPDTPPTPLSPAAGSFDSKLDREVALMHQSLDQGFDWDDDESEGSVASSAALAAGGPRARKPALARGLSNWNSRNPVNRMRRLVATASAIL